MCVPLHSLLYRQYVSYPFICFPFLHVINLSSPCACFLVTVYFNMRPIRHFDLLRNRLSIRCFAWRDRPSRSRGTCTPSLGHTRRRAGFRPGSASSGPRGSGCFTSSSSSGSGSSSCLRSPSTGSRSRRTPSPSCLWFIQLNVLTDN